MVEEIVNRRKRNGKTQYFVKWQGYPSTDNTWEDEDNLQNCAELIVEYISKIETKYNPSPVKKNKKEKVIETVKQPQKKKIMKTRRDNNQFPINEEISLGLTKLSDSPIRESKKTNGLKAALALSQIDEFKNVHSKNQSDSHNNQASLNNHQTNDLNIPESNIIIEEQTIQNPITQDYTINESVNDEIDTMAYSTYQNEQMLINLDTENDKNNDILEADTLIIQNNSLNSNSPQNHNSPNNESSYMLNNEPQIIQNQNDFDSSSINHYNSDYDTNQQDQYQISHETTGDLQSEGFFGQAMSSNEQYQEQEIDEEQYIQNQDQVYPDTPQIDIIMPSSNHIEEHNIQESEMVENKTFQIRNSIPQIDGAELVKILERKCKDGEIYLKVFRKDRTYGLVSRNQVVAYKPELYIEFLHNFTSNKFC